MPSYDESRREHKTIMTSATLCEAREIRVNTILARIEACETRRKTRKWHNHDKLVARRHARQIAPHKTRSTQRHTSIARQPSLTPQDTEIFQQMQKEAKKYSKRYNEPYHVDHIIPLNNKRVCGLHKPINWQIICGEYNVKKTNKLPRFLISLFHNDVQPFDFYPQFKTASDMRLYKSILAAP